MAESTYTPPYTTDTLTTQKMMRMLNTLYAGLTSNPLDTDMSQNCGKQDWRKSFCEKYGVPVTPDGKPSDQPKTIGDDFVYYDTNGTGPQMVAQRVLNALETAMNGMLTPPGGQDGVPLSQPLEYSALCAFFNTLLDFKVMNNATAYWDQFRNDSPSGTRSAALDKLGMNTNSYQERAALESFNPAGNNTQLQKSLKDLSATLYEQYSFAC